MVTPFYNAVKGTTSGTPGTGAFTPNAASTGFRAWSTVPTGWIGLVRYEDGSSWELTYSYWNGTTLSRASTQLYDSSSGSALSLTSSATAAMVVDGAEVMSHLGGTPWRGFTAAVNLGVPNDLMRAGNGPTLTGTAASTTLSNTNYLTEQPRLQITSATTANAQCGWSTSDKVGYYSSSSGHGGSEFTGRFGASQLPTSPRCFAGFASLNITSGEPSAQVISMMAFAKDSTDTNIQLLTKDGTTANKVDTGIALVANGWYEATVWAEPGGGKAYGLLIRMDTGAIWLGSTASNLPPTGTALLAQIYGGLNGSNTGTAFIIHIGSLFVRTVT